MKRIIRYKHNSNPMGRWNPIDNPNLKADYANIDSCGDRLCGYPNYFKKNKTKINNETTIRNNKYNS